MKVPFYLTVNKTGTIKTTKSRSDLRWDEVSIFVTLEIPDQLFKKPQISASITIPDEAAMPHEITAEVQDNIKNAIELAAGVEVKITIEDRKEEIKP